jgi:Na+-transporting NADH:ubiquinone oxidoreductase subunit B
MFGAMFMATDPVSGPMTLQGKWICGIMLGILTVIIRGLSGYVEGVMFSIILMNIFAPLIDNAVLAFIASKNRKNSGL